MNFKQAVCNANEGDTELRLKAVTPVRLLKANSKNRSKKEERGASPEELSNFLGKAALKKE